MRPGRHARNHGCICARSLASARAACAGDLARGGRRAVWLRMHDHVRDVLRVRWIGRLLLQLRLWHYLLEFPVRVVNAKAVEIASAPASADVQLRGVSFERVVPQLPKGKVPEPMVPQREFLRLLLGGAVPILDGPLLLSQLRKRKILSFRRRLVIRLLFDVGGCWRCPGRGGRRRG